MEYYGNQERKPIGFLLFLKKAIEFLKKIKKIFKNLLTILGRVLYNRSIEVGQSGAKCSEVLKEFQDFVKKRFVPPKKHKKSALMRQKI